MAVGTIQPIALSHLAQECLFLVIARRCHSALYWRSKRNFLPQVSTALSLACKSYLSALGAGLEGHCEREDHQLPNRCYSELNSSLMVQGFTAFPPLQTEQARFRALRFPVGPVDSGRADSPLPTERCTSRKGPSSACLSASVHFLFDRLTLTALHHVLAITARRWATTPPPSSSPYAGIVASHCCGGHGVGVPQFCHKRRPSNP